jgi:hypothetical protein
MPDSPQQYTQAEVQRLLAEQEEKLNIKWRTETTEGKVVALTEMMNKNHAAVVKRLDEVNHVKQEFNRRFGETEKKIDEAMTKQTEIMAAHMASPAHSLMNDHLSGVAHIEKTLKAIPVKELELLPDMLRHISLTEENKHKRNVFARSLEIRAGSAYAILGVTSLLASGFLWLVTHISLH